MKYMKVPRLYKENLKHSVISDRMIADAFTSIYTKKAKYYEIIRCHRFFKDFRLFRKIYLKRIRVLDRLEEQITECHHNGIKHVYLNYQNNCISSSL